MFAAPGRCRVGTIDRLLIIEAIVAHRYELRMEIGNFPFGRGEQRIVRRIGLQLGDLQEAGEINRLGALETLFERGERFVH